MRKLLASAADLILGASCPGCGRPGLGTCRACAAQTKVELIHREVAGLPAVAGGAYGGRLREVLLSFKVGQQTGHDRLLSYLLAAAIVELIGVRSAVVLVPVPTSRRSRRERDRDLVLELARGSASQLRRLGVAAKVVRALRLVRQPEDQHELDQAARQQNLAGAMGVRRQLGPHSHVVVIDDILTTGATLCEAVRALSESTDTPILGCAIVAAVKSFAGTENTSPISSG